MAFNISQGFKLQSPQFNFERDYFKSVAELKAAPESGFPDNFITNVAGVLYQLKKSNSVDATTGRWRKLGLGNLGLDLSAYAKKSETVPSTVTVNGTAIGSAQKNISTPKLFVVDKVFLEDEEAPTVVDTSVGKDDVAKIAVYREYKSATYMVVESKEDGKYHSSWEGGRNAGAPLSYGSRIVPGKGVLITHPSVFFSLTKQCFYYPGEGVLLPMKVAASKLGTARKLTVGATGKRFDGTADVSWTAKEMGVGTKIATAYAGGKRMLYLKTSDDSNLTSLELPAATASAGGVMSASDKSALDALSWYEGD